MSGTLRPKTTAHAKASIYQAFPPAGAFRLAFTPKHGSWLNMAESELGVLASQCLDRCIPDKNTLTKEVAAGQDQRNASGIEANWRFTTTDARIKLKRLYPQFE
jgi:hypothetical protein